MPAIQYLIYLYRRYDTDGYDVMITSCTIPGEEGQSVLVVCVPSYDLTHSAVLVRLQAGGRSLVMM